jgi:7,8-dihydropterin-6-yl-methyl-4-(beta-D-ribofuranosyl)aminobenzene 5'-phosphate synthase
MKKFLRKGANIMIKKGMICFICFGFLSFLPLKAADIHEAAHGGDLDRVKTLLKENPELLKEKSDSGGTAVHYAAHGGHIDVLDFLMAKGADINARDNQGSTPLVWAAAGGKRESIVLLLDKGADPNIKDGLDNSLLHIAVHRGQKDVAELLLSRGMAVNAANRNGTTPLIFSITRKQPEIMSLLLDKGADPNLSDSNGFTALRISVLFGNADAAGRLLSHGADPSEKYEDGITALHLACTEGHPRIAELLIQKGADIRLADRAGFTPLHMASFHGQTRTAEMLLARGLDANELSEERDTSLHGAAWGGYVETAELLIHKGAEINSKNRQGLTPIDYALKAGRQDMVKFLEIKGARQSGKGGEYRINNRGIPSIPDPEPQAVGMTVLYDNFIAVEGTRSAWGFSCLIEGTEKTILFDTGGEAEVLMHNIDTLNVDLQKVDVVVISHNHWDHTGGLEAVLEAHPGLPVYVPHSFPYEFIRRVEKRGHVIPVNKPVEVCRNIFLTGEMGQGIKELSLLFNSGQGPVLVTGCSHPGIVDIVKKSTEILGKKLHFVFGGFHLGGKPEKELNSIVEEFRKLGVEKCGATHCTGDQAINKFKEAYGKDYVSIGTGRVFHFKEKK